MLPVIVPMTDGVNAAVAARTAGVLAGIAYGTGRPRAELRAELKDALLAAGLGGVPKRRDERKALTAELDEEVRRRLERDAA
jgi:hypothetical protein